MNTRRRDFLAAASLAAAGSWVLRPARAMAARETGQPLKTSLTIVFDERRADSRAFALRARMAGACIVPLNDDIGALWFRTLLPAAGSGRSALGGLTTHADAFLIARFASGIGMRMTRRTIDARMGPGALVAWRLDHAPVQTG